MKKATVILALLSALGLSSCGGNSTTANQTISPTKPVTHLTYRLFITNTYSSSVNVMNAETDELTGFTFGTGANPNKMWRTPDGTGTLIYNASANSFTVLDNTLEKVLATVSLPSWTESVALSTGSTTAFAAVKNYSNGSYATPGAIVPFNSKDGSVLDAIPIPNVRYVAVDNAGKHLLTFTDVNDTPMWVDMTVSPPVVTPLDFSAFPLSKPIAAWFSSDDKTAYIMSCGAECGGTQGASITKYAVGSGPTAQLSVPSARIGLLSGTTLYVAGSPSGTGGTFSKIDLSAFTASPAVTISNGVKTVMQEFNNQVWVGASNCGGGCVTIVDPSANTAKVLGENGDATGITFVDLTKIVYTVEGGVLHEYDTSGNVHTNEHPIYLTGKLWDVLYAH